MQRDGHQSYNVVLLPPRDLWQESIRISRMVSQEMAVEFVLDGKSKFPHVTLYQLEIPNKNLKKTLMRLNIIFREQPKLPLTFAKMSHHGPSIVWGCKKTPPLYSLHRTVINELNYLREGLIVSDFLKLAPALPSQENIVKDFGWKGVLNYYDPHITLTRVKKESNIEKVLRLPKVKPVSEIFDKSALGKLSDFGTVVDLIEEFNLD